MVRPPVSVACCLVLVGVILTQLTGCGGPAGPKRDYADVTGTVKYNGKPVSKGTVIFQPASGAPVVGDLKDDGTYSLKGVIGPNTVMINNPVPPPPGKGGDDIAANKAAQADYDKALKAAKIVPDKYSSANSGLKFEVKAGPNKADFELQ